jgi:hypothetical protein
MGHIMDHKSFKAALQPAAGTRHKPQATTVTATGRKTSRKSRAWTGAAMSHTLLYC